MSVSEEESAISTSSDDEADLDDVLTYDKEPEYTNQEIAAGIADTWVNKEEAVASVESEQQWVPESRLDNTNSLVQVRRVFEDV